MTALVHFLAAVGVFVLLTTGATVLWILSDAVRERLANQRRADAANAYKAGKR